MADPITLEQAELQRIAQIQQVSQNITFEFGSIELAKRALDEREERANNALINLKASETELVQSLSEKYGDGSINLQNGTFEPSPQLSVPSSPAVEEVTEDVSEEESAE